MKKHVFKNSTYMLIVPTEKSISDIRESLAKTLVDEIAAINPLASKGVTYRWENPQTDDKTDLVIELQGENNIRLSTLEFGIQEDNKRFYVRSSSRDALARWVVYGILEKHPELVVQEFE